MTGDGIACAQSGAVRGGEVNRHASQRSSGSYTSLLALRLSLCAALGALPISRFFLLYIYLRRLARNHVSPHTWTKLFRPFRRLVSAPASSRSPSSRPPRPNATSSGRPLTPGSYATHFICAASSNVIQAGPRASAAARRRCI